MTRKRSKPHLQDHWAIVVGTICVVLIWLISCAGRTQDFQRGETLIVCEAGFVDVAVGPIDFESWGFRYQRIDSAATIVTREIVGLGCVLTH